MILNILFQNKQCSLRILMCFRISPFPFPAHVSQAVLNSYSKYMNFIFLLIQMRGNLCIFPKISLEILRIVSFWGVCRPSELRNITIARMGKMERNRKEWKRGGKKARGSPVFILHPGMWGQFDIPTSISVIHYIHKTKSETIISDLDCCSVLHETKDLFSTWESEWSLENICQILFKIL